jgi:hypothetical protein
VDAQPTLRVMADTELETLAQALGRTRKELQEQIDNAEHPEAERRKLDRKADRVRCGVERRDDEKWLDGETAESRERFEQLRTLTDAEMQQARASMTLGRQLDQALADASLLTAVGASEPGGTGHHGKLSGRGPGHIEGAMYSHGKIDVPTLYRRVLERMVAALWREVDGARRGSLVDLRKLETSQEKDARLIRDWEGIRSEVVSVLDPSLGSPRSIEMMRKRNNRRPIDGTSSERDRAA